MEIREFLLLALDEEERGLLRAVDSLNPLELSWQPGVEANSVGFILWHTIRGEDGLIQAVAQGKPHLWISQSWHQKMNMPADPRDSGGRYTAEQVAAFIVPPLGNLLDYHKAVRTATKEYIQTLDSNKLKETVHWGSGREMSLGELLSHLIAELNQHLGQIAYIRGLIRGLNK